MNASLSLSSITAPLSRFFGKYHATFFFTIIILLLAGAILSLYLTTSSKTDEDGSNGTGISNTFDQETVKEIQELRESGETPTNLTYPSPRSNPFVES